MKNLQQIKEEVRKLLIEHFDRSIVPFANWKDRDTPEAMESMGRCRAYLLAGCDFYLNYNYDEKVDFNDFSSFWKSEVLMMYISIKYFEFEEEPQFHVNYFPSPYLLNYCEEKANIHGKIYWD